MREARSLSLILAVGLVLGCGIPASDAATGIDGRFERVESAPVVEFLELKSNGQFLIYHQDQGGFEGTYEISGNTIRLKLQGPLPFVKIGSFDRVRGVIRFTDKVVFSGLREQTYVSGRGRARVGSEQMLERDRAAVARARTEVAIYYGRNGALPPSVSVGPYECADFRTRYNPNDGSLNIVSTDTIADCPEQTVAAGTRGGHENLALTGPRQTEQDREKILARDRAIVRDSQTSIGIHQSLHGKFPESVAMRPFECALFKTRYDPKNGELKIISSNTVADCP